MKGMMHKNTNSTILKIFPAKFSAKVYIDPHI